MIRTRTVALLTLPVLVALACGSEPTEPGRSPPDSGVAASTDTGTIEDAGLTPPPDAGAEPPPDAGQPVLDCSPLFDGGSEHLFALSACPQLQGGSAVCFITQDDCELAIQCGRDTYQGTVEPGRELSWSVDGVACTARMEDGALVGACEHGGNVCPISEVEPMAGAQDCPALPTGEFRTRGCGPTSIQCEGFLQHGCEFMAARCQVGSFPPLNIAGEVSDDDGQAHLEFNGTNGFECYVDEPTPSEIDGGRSPLEWRGQCETGNGGRCRDTGGYYGLQIFFASDEADACGADPEDASSTVGCNGGFATSEPAADSPMGACMPGDAEAPAGSCDFMDALCSAAEGAEVGTCYALCPIGARYVSTGGCPTGFRCFQVQTAAVCFQDCDTEHACPAGFTCDGEGSCVSAQ